MKLKTWKELVFVEHLTEAQQNEMKQEAIKQIKELENEEFVMSLKNPAGNDTSSAVWWIKYFFNITENDLK